MRMLFRKRRILSIVLFALSFFILSVIISKSENKTVKIASSDFLIKPVLAADRGCVLEGYDANHFWGYGYDKIQGGHCEMRRVYWAKADDSDNRPVISFPIYNTKFDIEIPEQYKDGKSYSFKVTQGKGEPWFCPDEGYVCGVININPSPSTPPSVPNCTNLSGPSTIKLGESGTYSADFSSPEGNLGGEVVAGQAGQIKWSPCYTSGSFSSACQFSGNSGTQSFSWTPTVVGTYDVLCRAWNDAKAECRGKASYVDVAPRYPCAGPNSSMTVQVVDSTGPSITPGGSPPPFTCGSGKVLPPPKPDNPCYWKSEGDANCDGKVDQLDYKFWTEQFDQMVPAAPVNQNANYSCVEGNPSTYFVDLTDFEVWRRNTLDGLMCIQAQI